MIENALLPKAGLLRSLQIQKSVVGALLMREILTRYGRDNLGFLWLFVEPMIFTSAVAVFWSLTRTVHGSGIPVVEFALTGYSCLLVWRNVGARCIKAIEPNLSLMFHRNVKLFDVVLARVFLEISGGTMSFALLTVVFWAFGLVNQPYDVLGVIGAWFLLCWFSLGLGLAVGALSEASELLDRLWHIAVYLMFPLSGAVFLVDWLPVNLHEWILLVPMVHITELLRYSFFGPIFKPHYSVFYVVVFDMLLSIVALLLLKRVSQKLEVE